MVDGFVVSPGMRVVLFLGGNGYLFFGVFGRVLWVEIILCSFRFIHSGLLSFLFSAIMVYLCFFLRPIIPIPIPRVCSLKRLLMANYFPLRFLIVRRGFHVRCFLLCPFVRVIASHARGRALYWIKCFAK